MENDSLLALLRPFRNVEQRTVALYWENIARHAVALLVEALRYKREGLGFDSRWCHWNFSFT